VRRRRGRSAAAPAPAPRAGPGDALRVLRERLADARDERDLLARTVAETTQDLELSRQRYADLYDLAPIGYATLDRHGCILEINVTGARLLGRGRRSLAGYPLRALMAPADRETWRDHLRRCSTSPGEATTEMTLALGGGRTRLVQIISRRVVGVDGRTRLLSTLVDITVRRQAEEALRASEQLARQHSDWLNTMLDTAPAIIWIAHDRECRSITGNRAAHELLQVAKGDDMSKSGPAAERLANYRVFHDGIELPPQEMPLQRVAASGAPLRDYEMELRFADGTSRLLLGNIAPLQDAAGQPDGAVGAFADITARKQTEIALARHQAWNEAKVAIGAAAVSGESLEGTLQSSLDAVAHAAGAPVGMIRLVDPETRNLVLIAGRNLLPSYRQEAARTRWGEYLAGLVAATGRIQVVEDVSDEPSLTLLARLTDPPISSLIGIPLQAEGQVVGTLALGHPQPRYFDAAAADELLSTADMLAGAIRAEQLREALRREAGSRALLLRELNHRVRNNLAALIGLLHLTADKLEDPAATSLNAVAERVGHLADLHELVSEREGGGANLRELVELAAKGALASPTEEPAVRWRVDGMDAQIPRTQAIPVTLVLHELFNNCSKHAFRGRPAGRVAVAIHRIGGDVCLEVSDDGPGPGPGPDGLGLSIAEALVSETLHGSLHLVSARDGGALACVRFPLRAELQPREENA
jgi:PAS domain S-box-containing protein